MTRRSTQKKMSTLPLGRVVIMSFTVYKDFFLYSVTDSIAYMGLLYLYSSTI